MTFFRLCAVPFTAYLILDHHLQKAFFIFALAALTDWADGFLARRWGVVSAFGQLFDPLADKALVIVTTILLGYTHYLPAWFVSLIVFRDIFLILGGLYIFARRLPFSLAPTMISKINTFAQLILLGLVMFFDHPIEIIKLFGTAPPPLKTYIFSLFFIAMMGVVVGTTFLSGWGYLTEFLSYLKKKAM